MRGVTPTRTFALWLILGLAAPALSQEVAIGVGPADAGERVGWLESRRQVGAEADCAGGDVAGAAGRPVEGNGDFGAQRRPGTVHAVTERQAARFGVEGEDFGASLAFGT